MRLRRLTLIISWLLSLESVCNAGEAEFEALVDKMEQDLLEFVAEMETYHSNRCDFQTLGRCQRNNHHETLSILPNQQCYDTGDLQIDVCPFQCGALWDYTTSTVRLSNSIVVNTTDFYPKDPRAVEMICYSSFMDEFLHDKRIRDQSYWDRYDVRSPQVYFGSTTGANRIFPGRTSPNQGQYDPRERPWYIAASSGPKNVILILDTSGTMRNRMVELRAAAKQVIMSLTTSDRVAIVQYSTNATKIAFRDKYLFTASETNKNILWEEIDNFEPIGSTNVYDAFVKAFEILDDSFRDELSVECNTAMLFLTDGQITKESNLTQQASEQRVTELVSSELLRFREWKRHDILLFTFTVDLSEDVELFPKSLACATGGVWSRIASDLDISDALTSYYRLFALGLGTGNNAEFSAWVEPYVFSTGGILGTTVSAPVYDRTGNHSIFLGVVGMDFSLALADRVLGEDANSFSAIDRVIRRSTARCPVLNLTLCELESYRRSGVAGDQALCTDSCRDKFIDVEEGPCVNTGGFLPSDLWLDRSLKGVDYEDRVCCNPGDENGVSATTTCGEPIDEDTTVTKSSVSPGVVVGIVVAGVVTIIGCLLFLWMWRQRRSRGNTTPLNEMRIMPPPS